MPKTVKKLGAIALANVFLGLLSENELSINTNTERQAQMTKPSQG